MAAADLRTFHDIDPDEPGYDVLGYMTDKEAWDEAMASAKCLGIAMLIALGVLIGFACVGALWFAGVL